MLTKKVMNDIRQHAEAEAPNECAGFVVMSGRKMKYMPVSNVAINPAEHVEVSQHDWVAAEEQGEIIRFIHSHAGDGCEPVASALDRSMCNETGVTWGIIAWPSCEYAEITPSEVPLLGRQFSLGGWDCYGLVMAYSAIQGVSLPDHRVTYPWWERGENRIMDNLEAAGFIVHDGPPVPGDAIIMQIGSEVPNHWAVYVGDGEIIHHMVNQVSCKAAYTPYFQQRTIATTRHKDMPDPEELKPWR